MAEVLITLGIIGVVAAITIPSLVSNYQKAVTVNKLKHFSANVNKALRLSNDDIGDIYSCTSSAANCFNKYLKPYLKANVTQNYIHLSNISTDFIKLEFLDGTMALFARATTSLFSRKATFIFYTKNIDFKNQGETNAFVNVADDKTKPTREKFYFIVNDDNTLVPLPKGNYSREELVSKCKNGISYGSFTDNDGNKTKIESGHYYCATLIKEDGWAILNDYPW